MARLTSRTARFRNRPRRRPVSRDDVIRKVNGEAVAGAQDLVNKISKIAPGQSVKLEIWREKASKEFDLTLAEYPGRCD